MFALKFLSQKHRAVFQSFHWHLGHFFLKGTCRLLQILAKKSLVGIGQKLTEKIQKVRLPNRAYMGVPFEIVVFRNIVLVMVVAFSSTQLYTMLYFEIYDLKQGKKLATF